MTICHIPSLTWCHWWNSTNVQVLLFLCYWRLLLFILTAIIWAIDVSRVALFYTYQSLNHWQRRHTALTSHTILLQKIYDPSAHGLVSQIWLCIIYFDQYFSYDFFFTCKDTTTMFGILKENKKLGKYSSGYLSVCSGRWSMLDYYHKVL